MKRSVQPNVFALQDSPVVDEDFYARFGEHADDARRVMEAFQDAKEYGSIIQPNVTLEELDQLEKVLIEQDEMATYGSFATQIAVGEMINAMSPMIPQTRALVQKYHVVVTNPPYMGVGSMGANLFTNIKNMYPYSKSDLFAVFIERCRDMEIINGYQAMITQHAWMFLSSFEKLRTKLRFIDTVNMAHLGPRAFEEIGGEVVQTTSFVLRKNHSPGYRGTYCRLIEPSTQKGKEDMFIAGKNRFFALQDNFIKIPGGPIAYWVSEKYISIFSNKTMSEYGSSCIGMRTGDNERFLRLWHEISLQRFGLGFPSAKAAMESGKKWFPYCKGGAFRKWYGNNEYLVNWESDGAEIKENTRRVYPYLGDNLGWKISNENYYFTPGLTWSGVGARVFGVRSYPEGMIFDSGANSYFVNKPEHYYYFAGLLNCIIINDVINVINPTINTGCGVIAQLPAILSEAKEELISGIVRSCISISKIDWDSFETSWDFQVHPLVRCASFSMEEMREDEKHHIRDMNYIEEAYIRWSNECYLRFQQLKTNEEELNHIFIDIYGLQDELTPEVEDKDVTVRKADLGRDIRSLISYAVGCMFGRYSIDEPGLILAGQKYSDKFVYASMPVAGGDPLFTVQGDCYLVRGKNDVVRCTFVPDQDGILAITDDEYFDDDIVFRFVEWVRTVFGADTLEDNLKFIADALPGKGTPREVIRQYFLNDFYKDHLKVYQKRPIYWLFDSGKKNGFKCLIYMHRYQPDTLARIRTDYLHELQGRYRNAIDTLDRQIAVATTSERVKLQKRLTSLKAQAEEARVYEEKIHHLADQMIKVDLDDGVKHNYAIFKDVLAPIK